ncbi:hypothetical protein LCGC14_0668720 [marine sediment metagenome]|uniref:G8 domain-containing protein n=1 Tax=marine sediment metagenome TaxID=412755 RepID=A0A0F9QRJ5_9ZZZZ
MTDYTSTGTGDWDNVAVWGGGGFPAAGDTATISTGDIVSVKGSELCGNISVLPGGGLRFDGQSDTVAAQMTLDNGATITNNGAVDATATGTTGPARIVGASLEVMAGTDWTWDNQTWEIVNMDIQFNIATGGGISQSIIFKTSLCTIDDLDVQTGATVSFDVASCTANGVTVSGGILLLEEAISFTSFTQATGTTTPASSSTAITCSGAWEVSGGTWTDQRSQVTLTGTANFQHSIASNNRTNTFEQSGAITTTLTGAAYMLSWFRGSATGTLSGSQTIQVGTSGSALPFDNNGVTINSGVQITLISGHATPTMDSGTYHHLTLEGSGVQRSFTMNGVLICNGNLILNSALALLTTTGTDYALTCAGIGVATGTLTGNDSVITSSTLLTVAGGTLTWTGTAGRLDVNDFTMASGTCTPSATTSDIQCSGDYNMTGGTWTNNRGTLTLTASGNLAHNGSGGNRISAIVHAAGVTSTLTNFAYISAAHTFSATSHLAGGSTVVMSTASGLTFPSGATMTGGAVYRFISGGGTVTAAGSFNSVLFQSNSTYTLGAALTAIGTVAIDDVTGAVTLDCATFALAITSTFTIDATSLLDLGTSAGHVITANFTPLGDIDGASSTLTCSGNVDLSNILFTRNSSTLAMDGASKTLDSGSNQLENFTISNTVTLINNTFTIFGVFTNTSTFTIASGIKLSVSGTAIGIFNNSGGTVTGADATSILDFTISSSAANQVLNNTGIITVLATQFRGSVSISANKTITLGANFTTAADIVVLSDHASRTLTLDTSGTDYNILCADLTLTGTTGGVLIANASIITASGDVDLSAATFTYGTSTLAVGGDLTTGANSDIFATLNITGTCAFSGSNSLCTTAFTNTGTITLAAGSFRLTCQNAAITAFDNSAGTISGVDSTPFLSFRGTATTTYDLDNDGTIGVDCRFIATGNSPTIRLVNESWVTTGNVFFALSGGTAVTLDTNGQALTCADLTLIANSTITGGASTITASGDVDLSAGTFTEGTSTMAMTGTSKTLTLASNQEVYNLTVTGTVVGLAGSGVQIQFDNVLTIDGGTATFGMTVGDQVLIGEQNSDGFPVVLANGGDFQNSDTGSIRYGDGSTGATINIAASTNYPNLIISSSGAVANTYNMVGAVTCINLTIGDGADADVVDTVTFALKCTGTVDVLASASLQTGANAGGATWDFASTVTVAGTAQISVTSGAFSLVLGSKTVSVRDQLTVANHVSRGNAVFTTGGTGHVDQRVALTGGQISMGRRVGWNGLYIQDCIIAQGTDMRGAWFGRGNLGVIRRTPSRSVQGIGPLGVRYG